MYMSSDELKKILKEGKHFFLLFWFSLVFFSGLDWIGTRKFCRLGTEGTPERGSGGITPGENFLKQSTIFSLILLHFLSMRVQFYFMTKPAVVKHFEFCKGQVSLLFLREIAYFNFVLQN